MVSTLGKENLFSLRIIFKTGKQKLCGFYSDLGSSTGCASVVIKEIHLSKYILSLLEKY